ncbi:MAG: hypothetical protein H0T51_10655 [Pirellulales bacterium]|nr:hypothetical protein [Pirellulales bacterium]
MATSMHPRKQLIAGALACLAALSGLAATAPAQEPLAGPTYSRMRTGAEDWQARGGNYAQGYGRGGHGWGGGFFQPYISPVVASSWYQRPYPYHFDYFRGRWDGGQSGYAGESPQMMDCPCAEDGAPTLAAPNL